MSAKYKAIYRSGKLFAEYENGELTYLDPTYSGEKRSALPMPMVMRDIGAYCSPIDGAMITSRNQHRDHIRRHDVIEVGNEKIGQITAARDAASSGVDHDLAQSIKRRVEEVTSMAQVDYDSHVEVQQKQHAEVASLITA